MNSTINTALGKKEERKLLWVVCVSNLYAEADTTAYRGISHPASLSSRVSGYLAHQPIHPGPSSSSVHLYLHPSTPLLSVLVTPITLRSDYTSRPRHRPSACRTGNHTVADLHCASCKASLGWMYIKAPNGEQRYKEGRSHALTSG